MKAAAGAGASASIADSSSAVHGLSRPAHQPSSRRAEMGPSPPGACCTTASRSAPSTRSPGAQSAAAGGGGARGPSAPGASPPAAAAPPPVSSMRMPSPASADPARSHGSSGTVSRGHSHTAQCLLPQVAPASSSASNSHAHARRTLKNRNARDAASEASAGRRSSSLSMSTAACVHWQSETRLSGSKEHGRSARTIPCTLSASRAPILSDAAKDGRGGPSADRKDDAAPSRKGDAGRGAPSSTTATATARTAARPAPIARPMRFRSGSRR